MRYVSWNYPPLVEAYRSLGEVVSLVVYSILEVGQGTPSGGKGEGGSGGRFDSLINSVPPSGLRGDALVWSDCKFDSRDGSVPPSEVGDTASDGRVSEELLGSEGSCVGLVGL